MLEIAELRKQLRALDDSDDALKRQALQALRGYNEPDWATVPADVCDALVKSLQTHLHKPSKQPSTQKEAATILGNLGVRSRAAVPQLIELLRAGGPDAILEAVATALGKIGKEAKAAVDPLLRLLAEARPSLAARAIRALGSLGCADERVRTALVDLWLSPVQHQSGKGEVAIALCRLRIAAPNLIEAVTKSLVTGAEVSLRKSAAEALTWCRKTETDVVPALLTASLSDTNEEVRQLAQAGLDHMSLSQEKAVRLCATQLGESTYAEVALRKSGALGVPALIEALESADAAVRIKAARTLSTLGEVAAAAAPALGQTLQDDDPEVRLAAAKSLWNVAKAADLVVPVLVELLEARGTVDADVSENERRFLQTVMEALGRIEPPATAAVPALTLRTKDKNRQMRESALSVLQKVAPTVAKKVVLRP